MVSSKGKPNSGSKKKDKGGHNDSFPWTAVYGALGVAALAVAFAVLSTASSHFRKKNTDTSKGTEALDAAVKAAEQVLAAEEQMKLMGHKAELHGKVDKVLEQGASLIEQREKAEKEKAELEEMLAEAKALQNPEQLGPSVMSAQSGLIGRLLEMVSEVDQMRGEDRAEERLAVTKRVQAQLETLEAEAAKEEVGSAVKKQQAALIALVRSALKSDEDGEEMADMDWSEEALQKKFGLVTYASEVYWQEAYTAGRYGKTFDWYGAWEKPDSNGQSLADLVRPLIAPTVNNLVLGCGNSNMSAVLHGEGHKPIVSVDISEAVIEQMRSMFAGYEGMEWAAMDVTKMGFGDGSFDFVIEKGLFDALYAGSGERVPGALAEVARVLRPGGRFVSVSFSRDRLDRLFGGKGAGEEPEDEVSAAANALNCRKLGTLVYQQAKAADSDSAEDAPDSKKNDTTVYVYGCERRG